MSTTVIVILVGLAGVIGFVIIEGQISRGKDKVAKGWPVTTGTVVCSEVGWRTKRLGRGNTIYHFPVVRYSYSVAGQEYHGDRLSFGSVESMIAAKAEEMRSRFPEGTTVEVRYNPLKPDECIVAAMIR